MPAPLYFLSDVTRAQLSPRGALSRGLLADFGLTEIFADVRRVDELHPAEVAPKGPDGRPGLLISATSADQATLYRPTRQTWRRLTDRLWIGLELGPPPGPTDLARPKLLEGYAVELADGQLYQVPLLRRPDGRTSLPRRLGWDDEGQFEARIAPQYETLWEASAQVHDLVFHGGNYDLEWAVDFCLRALALNYRVDRHLQNVLGLLDSDAVPRVFDAVVDLPWYHELIASKKKNAAAEAAAEPPPAGPSTSPGPAA